MARPEIDPKLLKELEEQAEGCLNILPPDARMLQNRQNFKEMFMSGDWLDYQLEQIGVEKDEREKICFAHGQRCFGKLDYWAVAQEQLDKVREGKPDVPGILLAEEITAEVLGGDIVTMIERRNQRRKELHDKYTKFVE